MSVVWSWSSAVVCLRWVRRMSIAGGTHRSARHGWDVALLMHSGVWIHAFLRADVSELHVLGWLHQTLVC